MKLGAGIIGIALLFAIGVCVKGELTNAPTATESHFVDALAVFGYLIIAADSAWFIGWRDYACLWLSMDGSAADCKVQTRGRIMTKLV